MSLNYQANTQPAMIYGTTLFKNTYKYVVLKYYLVSYSLVMWTALLGKKMPLLSGLYNTRALLQTRHRERHQSFSLLKFTKQLCEINFRNLLNNNVKLNLTFLQGYWPVLNKLCTTSRSSGNHPVSDKLHPEWWDASAVHILHLFPCGADTCPWSGAPHLHRSTAHQQALGCTTYSNTAIERWCRTEDNEKFNTAFQLQILFPLLFPCFGTELAKWDHGESALYGKKKKKNNCGRLWNSDTAYTFQLVQKPKNTPSLLFISWY